MTINQNVTMRLMVVVHFVVGQWHKLPSLTFLIAEAWAIRKRKGPWYSKIPRTKQYHLNAAEMLLL